jgi:hypothetical protein
VPACRRGGSSYGDPTRNAISAIRERISKEEIVFLTQDSEFEKMPGRHRGIVLISRIRQSLPIQKRTEILFSAVEKFMAEKPSGKLFELLETGEVVACGVH